MEINKWVESDMYEILVSEDYMEEILTAEGFDIKDDTEVDSTLVCDYAIWELGFENLGDFGYGFIFKQNRSEMQAEFSDKYFNWDWRDIGVDKTPFVWYTRYTIKKGIDKQWEN